MWRETVRSRIARETVRSRIARTAAGIIIGLSGLSPILAAACNAQPRPVPISESGGLPGVTNEDIRSHYPELEGYRITQAINFSPENNPNHPLITIINFTPYIVDGQKAKGTFEYFERIAAQNIGISWKNQGHEIRAVLTPYPAGQQKRVVVLVPGDFPSPAWEKTDAPFFTQSFDQPERLRFAVIKVDKRDYIFSINYGFAVSACQTTIKAEPENRESLPKEFTWKGEKIDQESFVQAATCYSLGAPFYYRQAEFLHPAYRFAIGLSRFYPFREFGFAMTPQMYEAIPKVGNVIVSP